MPNKAVILSEAPKARSRRACPERSRGNLGDTSRQMLFGALSHQFCCK
jgi:hypothetical protein